MGSVAMLVWAAQASFMSGPSPWCGIGRAATRTVWSVRWVAVIPFRLSPRGSAVGGFWAPGSAVALLWGAGSRPRSSRSSGTAPVAMDFLVTLPRGLAGVQTLWAWCSPLSVGMLSARVAGAVADWPGGAAAPWGRAACASLVLVRPGARRKGLGLLFRACGAAPGP